MLEYFIDSMFESCTSLESIVIPDGVKILGGNLFWGCTNLKEVTLPTSLVYIHQWIFYNRPEVTVNYLGNTEQWNKLEKHEDWALYCPKVTVITSDGVTHVYN